jgi:hypothetical protein
VAAVDAGPAMPAVIDVAASTAEILDADLEIVAVGPEPQIDRVPPGQPPLRSVPGEPTAWIDTAVSEPDLKALVLGIRSLPGGRRPAGHVALHALAHCPQLVVVVPPELDRGHRSLSNIIVPVSGRGMPCEPLLDVVGRLRDCGRAVRALHVLDPASAPAFVDRWHDPELWQRQFWQHHWPPHGDVDVRLGHLADGIIEAIADVDADGVLLEWTRRPPGARDSVVHDLLSRSSVPVLLVPHRRRSDEPAPWSTVAPSERGSTNG